MARLIKEREALAMTVEEMGQVLIQQERDIDAWAQAYQEMYISWDNKLYQVEYESNKWKANSLGC